MIDRMHSTEKKKLWEMLCTSARLPVVDHAIVVDEWKKYVGGVSNYSGVALNNDIDPNMTSIGVSFHKKLTASHTTKTTALLDRLIKMYTKCFGSREEFLNQMQARTIKIANKVYGKDA